ncbi:MAG: phosphate propanoyltransferase [Bacillota bacterium]
MGQQLIEQAVGRGLDVTTANVGDGCIPVGVSNRHVHLSEEHLEILFGEGFALTKDKLLLQGEEFAAKETVTLVGPKGVIQKVRVLGPVRKSTQVEISRTDGYTLGVMPPVLVSGQTEGSAGIVVVGSKGAVTLSQGVICAARHVHMNDEDARRYGVADQDRVTIKIAGERGGTFTNVLVRVSHDARLELHIDTDEANAVGLKNGDVVSL